MNNYQIIQGDALAALCTLPDQSVNTCVTSPPYYGLRDYGVDGQIGLEPSPAEYVAKMVDVFREVRRVLRADGTCWVNLGDSYASSGGISQPHRNNFGGFSGGDNKRTQGYARSGGGFVRPKIGNAKQLLGIPWRVAFALQADGWYLRQDIIWHKPNPMPESVRDRCTKAHEYIFLLAKSERYYFDCEAMKEPAVYAGQPRGGSKKRYEQNNAGMDCKVFNTRNKRSVWTVNPRPYKGAHFATFPPDLIRPCVLAGCPEGGTVLDPFNGSGTTGQVAIEEGRKYMGIELNPTYVELAHERIGKAIEKQSSSLFAGVL